VATGVYIATTCRYERILLDSSPDSSPLLLSLVGLKVETASRLHRFHNMLYKHIARFLSKEVSATV